MFRLRGLSELIRELAPPVVTDAFGLLTNLGDPYVLLVVVAVYYWLSDDRRNASVLVAYTLMAVAVTVALKRGFALPRPPVAVQQIAADAQSYGFPSGHAIGSTVVYGGLVAVDERLHRFRRALAVGLFVALIGLSRVVLGVHYLADVLVGFAVGALVLAALWRTDERAADAIVALAALPAGLAVVVSGAGTDALVVFGATLGGALALVAVDVSRLRTVDEWQDRALVVVLGLVLLGGVYELAVRLAHPVALVAGGAVMLASALVVPNAVKLLGESEGLSE